jgi:hypothetical protein
MCGMWNTIHTTELHVPRGQINLAGVGGVNEDDASQFSELNINSYPAPHVSFVGAVTRHSMPDCMGQDTIMPVLAPNSQRETEVLLFSSTWWALTIVALLPVTSCGLLKHAYQVTKYQWHTFTSDVVLAHAAMGTVMAPNADPLLTKWTKPNPIFPFPAQKRERPR